MLTALLLLAAGAVRALPVRSADWRCQNITHHFRHQTLWIAADSNSGCLAIEKEDNTIYSLNRLSQQTPSGTHARGASLVCSLEQQLCGWQLDPLCGPQQSSAIPDNLHARAIDDSESAQDLTDRLNRLEYKWASRNAEMPIYIIEQVEGLECRIARAGGSDAEKRDIFKIPGSSKDRGDVTLEQLEEQLSRLQDRYGSRTAPAWVTERLAGLQCRVDRISEDPGSMQKRDAFDLDLDIPTQHFDEWPQNTPAQAREYLDRLRTLDYELHKVESGPDGDSEENQHVAAEIYAEMQGVNDLLIEFNETSDANDMQHTEEANPAISKVAPRAELEPQPAEGEGDKPLPDTLAMVWDNIQGVEIELEELSGFPWTTPNNNRVRLLSARLINLRKFYNQRMRDYCGIHEKVVSWYGPGCDYQLWPPHDSQ